MKRNRWYDQYTRLGAYLDSFKTMEPKYRNPLVRDVIDTIRKSNPELLDEENAFNFPLDINRRRWYDRDPMLWLMFNSLKNAEKGLREKITKFLGENIDVINARKRCDYA
ncbi:MAG: hypothetical protein GF401_17125 [Chitinivibrionales bacterium]|nr:hypothetical protein [Chitinivibrionales bacterium]